MRRLDRPCSKWWGLCGLLFTAAHAFGAAPTAQPAATPLSIRVSLPPGLAPTPLTGRLLIMFAPLEAESNDDLRLDLSPTTEAIAFFGENVQAWRPGQMLTLSAHATGFPYATLLQLPPGRYRLQASFERYERYRRADGHTLYLPIIESLGNSSTADAMPRRWYSPAESIVWEGRQTPKPLILNIPVSDPPAFRDTPWVKSLRVRSQRLSEFWGRDIFLGALVTLPVGYDEHPHLRYPWLIRLGGLPLTPSHWRERAPAANLSMSSLEWRSQQAAWENFQYWQAPSTPRMVLVELQHPTPYADSSLATNSLNNGPYADAIRYELIPAIEDAFRVEQASWARVLTGAADGGWSALALQLRYPQDFNGAWAICPDPVDFRHFGLVDLQHDTNALFMKGRHLQLPRAARRDASGATLAELPAVSRWEQALADRARSRETWHRWEAAFSPQDPSGYPRRLWRPDTGVIDDETAEYWYQQHDLLGVLQGHSPEVRADLRGKLRVRIGDRDAYFFDNAVRSFAETLQSTYPELALSVDFGEGVAECWSGRHDLPPAEARWRHIQDLLPWAFERAAQAAPAGTGLSRWR